VTAIIGPNACGKSTLLRTCGRLLKPSGGEVQLDGRNVRTGKHRTAGAAAGVCWRRGRFHRPASWSRTSSPPVVMPHQGLLRQWRQEDETAVDDALQRCDLLDLRYREIGTLSGGQRQRAWFGMVLAQQTPVLLLDEPTTFLDLSAQVHLLDMALALNREQWQHGRDGAARPQHGGRATPTRSS
jgi:ABC-type cobalamin/Fe3+-siderophores transport system ATPase subunit